MWPWTAVDWLWQDVRYAFRGMRRSPGFTVVAVLSLALGIGANTAIFSLLSKLILRKLPVERPEQLVEFLKLFPGDPFLNTFPWQSYEYFRDHNHSLAGITGVSGVRFHVRGDGLEPEIVNGESVVGNFFPLLGLKPAIGRLFGAEVDRMGAADSAVAVVSWSYWKSRFNLNKGVLGRRIVVGDTPVTIVGVAPRNFVGMLAGVPVDIWMPRPADRKPGNLPLVGRLRPGVSIEQARAEMAVLFQTTVEEEASHAASASRASLERQQKFAMEPAGAGLNTPLRDLYAKPLLALMAVVALLLLVACANLANILLARGAGRQREMALRLSLGAGRFRLMGQVLTESLLLSGTGALIGAFLAYFGGETLLRIMTSGQVMMVWMPTVEIDLRPNLQVLLFTGGVALLTGLLFGFAPAWSAFTSVPASSLREIGRAGELRSRRLFAKSLVTAQVALSVILLSAARLFVTYLSNLQHLDLGFRRDHILLVNLNPEGSGYSREQLSRAYRDLLLRLETIPGVRSATLGSAPISLAAASSFAVAEGFEEKLENRRYISIRWVGPKFFETLGTPILAGRDFAFQDEGGPRVAIINRAMARYFFANRDPIGKHIALERDWKGFGVDKPYEIVGVVGDAKYHEIRETPPRTIYFNAFREGGISSGFLLRTNVDPLTIGPEVRGAVSELLKSVPVERITTLSDQIDSSIVPERLIATLSGLFGALGGLLAAIGLYGLLAYTVARRTNEIGVRIALGATQNRVTWMVLKDAMAMVCAGLTIGVPVAFWARSLAVNLFQDLPKKGVVPITFGVTAMIGLALFAAFIPARRAASVDPMEALRYE